MDNAIVLGSGTDAHSGAFTLNFVKNVVVTIPLATVKGAHTIDVRTLFSDPPTGVFGGTCQFNVANFCRATASIGITVGLDTTITKELTSGPRIDDGGTLVDLTGLATGSNDAGPIDVGRTDAQFYEFVIEITGDEDLAGAVATDVIPAEYDLDPQCGEDTADPDICDMVQTGDVDRDADGNADGIVNETPDACTVTTSTSGGGKKKLGAGLEPEFVDIALAGDFAFGDVCTVRVFVHTAENPGKFTSLFEPTGCRELDVDTFDTIALNDGVKLFDTEAGERLLGPIGLLQLTPNNCP